MVFADRHRRRAEGRRAAARRRSLPPDAVVLGIPRGGVVVAAEVARELGLPLSVVAPAKVGAPGNPEYAIGAVAPTACRAQPGCGVLGGARSSASRARRARRSAAASVMFLGEASLPSACGTHRDRGRRRARHRAHSARGRRLRPAAGRGARRARGAGRIASAVALLRASCRRGRRGRRAARVHGGGAVLPPASARPRTTRSSSCWTRQRATSTRRSRPWPARCVATLLEVSSIDRLRRSVVDRDRRSEEHRMAALRRSARESARTGHDVIASLRPELRPRRAVLPQMGRPARPEPRARDHPDRRRRS